MSFVDVLLVPQAQCPGHVECGPRTKAAGESDKDRNEEKAADCQVVRSSASAGVPEQALANSDSQSAVVELAQEVSPEMSFCRYIHAPHQLLHGDSDPAARLPCPAGQWP